MNLYGSVRGRILIPMSCGAAEKVSKADPSCEMLHPCGNALCLPKHNLMHSKVREHRASLFPDGQG